MDLVAAAQQLLENRAEREQMSQCWGCVSQDGCHRYHVFSVGVNIVRLTLSRPGRATSAPLAPIAVWRQPHPSAAQVAKLAVAHRHSVLRLVLAPNAYGCQRCRHS